MGDEILEAGKDEYDQTKQSASKWVAVLVKGGRKQVRKQIKQGYAAVQFCAHRQKRVVVGYPDVVIRLARKTRRVGRRVVAVAVLSL